MDIKTGRMERLATLLDGYAPKGDLPQFDLESWGERRVETTGALWWKQNHVCNTTACAVGLACLSGEFSSDGLRMRWTISDREKAQDLIPVYAGDEGYPAIQSFFGLNEEQAHHVFGWESYDGPTQGEGAAKEVARRIRSLIASERPAPQARIEQIKIGLQLVDIT